MEICGDFSRLENPTPCQTIASYKNCRKSPYEADSPDFAITSILKTVKRKVGDEPLTFRKLGGNITRLIVL
jgi:hypothetical protein